MSTDDALYRFRLRALVAEVTALDVVAPLAFLALVLALSVEVLRGRLSPAAARSSF